MGGSSIDGSVPARHRRGIRVPTHRGGFGYVFARRGRFFPHLTVMQKSAVSAAGFADSGKARRHLDYVVICSTSLRCSPAAGPGSRAARNNASRSPRIVWRTPGYCWMDSRCFSRARRKDEIRPTSKAARRCGSADRPTSSFHRDVTRLATTIVLIASWRVPPGPVQGSWAAPTSIRWRAVSKPGLFSRCASTRTDPRWSLTELTAISVSSQCPVWRHPPAPPLRVRIRARDVILAITRPAGVSALTCWGGRPEVERPGSDRGWRSSKCSSALVVRTLVGNESPGGRSKAGPWPPDASLRRDQTVAIARRISAAVRDSISLTRVETSIAEIEYGLATTTREIAPHRIGLRVWTTLYDVSWR